MVCPKCGFHFRVSDARDDFNCHFNFEFDYDSDVSERLCCDCAIEEIEAKMGFDESSDEGMSEACIACGGPYPDCVDSCPLFDD